MGWRERLAGKTGIVTAAGQGIGRATALAFAAEGRACSPPTSRGEAGTIGRRADRDPPARCTDDGAIAAIAEEARAARRVLFNCAGFVHHGTILDADPIEWDASFALNVRSMLR